jgi:hypothetical protein
MLTLPRLVAIESRNLLYQSQRPLVIVSSQPGSGIPLSKINNAFTKESSWALVKINRTPRSCTRAAPLVGQVGLTAYSSSMPPDFFRLALVKYRFSEVPWHIMIRFSTSLVFSPPPLFILRPRTKASLIGKAALRAHVSPDISCRLLQSLDTLISDTPSAEFPDHNTVSWNIEADAQTKPFLAKVGTANNSEQSFTIFKDDNHEVFDRDGFHFAVRYFAQAQ